jgi:menaquinone-dependent protoporphyrinogen oxidase
MNALVVFHSVDGQVEKIASRVAEHLRGRGADVTMASAAEAPAPDGFDVVVLGDSIHVSHHSKELTAYLRAHVGSLNEMPAALFQVSLISAGEGERPERLAHGLVDELLADTGFDPDLVGLFAGAVLYRRYGWVKRRIMRSIVAREGGDTDISQDHEYTDWQAVDQFAEDVGRLVAT